MFLACESCFFIGNAVILLGENQLIKNVTLGNESFVINAIIDLSLVIMDRGTCGKKLEFRNTISLPLTILHA